MFFKLQPKLHRAPETFSSTGNVQVVYRQNSMQPFHLAKRCRGSVWITLGVMAMRFGMVYTKSLSIRR